MTQTKIAVIGGSGIYEIDGLQNADWVQVETPWGDPSDQLLTGSLDGVEMVFLPRHGRGHVHAQIAQHFHWPVTTGSGKFACK